MLPREDGSNRSRRLTRVEQRNLKKQRLIDMVFNRGISVKKSAKALSIPYSTAKYISRQFRQKNGLKEETGNNPIHNLSLSEAATSREVASEKDGPQIVSELGKIQTFPGIDIFKLYQPN